MLRCGNVHPALERRHMSNRWPETDAASEVIKRGIFFGSYTPAYGVERRNEWKGNSERWTLNLWTDTKYLCKNLILLASLTIFSAHKHVRFYSKSFPPATLIYNKYYKIRMFTNGTAIALLYLLIFKNYKFKKRTCCRGFQSRNPWWRRKKSHPLRLFIPLIFSGGIWAFFLSHPALVQRRFTNSSPLIWYIFTVIV
jgi:hypothetical protein